MKQKNKTKQNKHTNEETLNLWIDLENWEFLETQGNLAFYVTALLEYVHLIFLRTSKREKREYILFDVVKWVVQLNNYKHDIRNSKKSFSY